MKINLFAVWIIYPPLVFELIAKFSSLKNVATAYLRKKQINPNILTEQKHFETHKHSTSLAPKQTTGDSLFTFCEADIFK